MREGFVVGEIGDGNWQITRDGFVTTELSHWKTWFAAMKSARFHVASGKCVVITSLANGAQWYIDLNGTEHSLEITA